MVFSGGYPITFPQAIFIWNGLSRGLELPRWARLAGQWVFPVSTAPSALPELSAAHLASFLCGLWECWAWVLTLLRQILFQKAVTPGLIKKILLTPFFRSGNPDQPARHSTICQGSRTDKLCLTTGSPLPGCVFYLLWDVILGRVSACDLFPELKEEWTQRVRQGSRYQIPAGSAGLPLAWAVEGSRDCGARVSSPLKLLA